MLSAFPQNSVNRIRPYHSKLLSLARALDCTVIFFSFYGAIVLTGSLDLEAYAWISSVGVLLFLLISDGVELYCLNNKASFCKQVILASISCGTTFFILFLLVYSLFPNALFPIAFMLAWSALSFSFIIFLNAFRRLLLMGYRKATIKSRRFAIAGANPLGMLVREKINSLTWLSDHFSGFYDDRSTPALRYDAAVGVEVEGNFAALIAAAKLGDIDIIYITVPMSQDDRIQSLLRELADTTASVYIVPDFNSFDLVAPKWNMLEGLPVVSVFDTPFGMVETVLKRMLDIVAGTVILGLIAMPMVAIAILIKVTSKGPVLFKQKRYGVAGEPIEVWKFRSMSVTENGRKIVQAGKNDSRVTTFGRFIRRTSLDELPQFVNVLQGRMSIVGPRPHAVAHNEYYRTKVQGYMLRHKVKPGITGLAQIKGCRGETSTDDKMQDRVRYDLEYITSWSLMMDLKIIFWTIFKGFVGKNVY